MRASPGGAFSGVLGGAAVLAAVVMAGAAADETPQATIDVAGADALTAGQAGTVEVEVQLTDTGGLADDEAVALRGAVSGAGADHVEVAAPGDDGPVDLDTADGAFVFPATATPPTVGELADGATFPLEVTVADAAADVELAIAVIAGQYPAAETTRLAGPDRVATAVQVARHTHPDGADVAYLAHGWGFADALAGGAAAARADAPLLVTGAGELAEPARAELARLDVDEVRLLGGSAALSATVEAQADAVADRTVRRSGADRYATAATIARAQWDEAATVVVATGAAFADALAGVPAAASQQAPLLLTGRDHLPAVTRDAIDWLDADRVIVLGGKQAVSSEVAAELADVAGDVDRVGGATRAHTAAAVADALWDGEGDVAYLAAGHDFADALTGGPAAAAEHAPILVADGLPAPTAGFLADHTPTDLRVLGGRQALAAELDAQARRAATPDRDPNTVDELTDRVRVALDAAPPESVPGPPAPDPAIVDHQRARLAAQRQAHRRADADGPRRPPRRHDAEAAGGRASTLGATATLAGTVTDTGDEPAAGVSVGVVPLDRPTGGVTVTTDADGTWDTGSRPVRPGRYLVRAEDRFGPLGLRWHADGSATGARNASGAAVVDVGADEHADGIDVALPDGGSVAGTVTRTDGAAVENACVELHGQGQPVAVNVTATDADGRYRLGGHADGDYRVRVRNCGGDAEPVVADPHWWDGSVDRTEAALVPVREGAVTPGVDFTADEPGDTAPEPDEPDPTGDVHGRVVDDDGDAFEPSQRACVELVSVDEGGRDYGRTAFAGEFAIDNAAPGDYHLKAIDCSDVPELGRQWYPGVDERMAAETITVTAGETTELADLPLVPTDEFGRVEGTLTVDGDPPSADAIVAASPDGFTSVIGPEATVADDGAFAFPALHAGPTELWAFVPGQEVFSEFREVTVETDQTQQADFNLDPAGAIAGAVVTPEGTTPPLVDVVAESDGQFVSSAASELGGFYRLGWLDPDHADDVHVVAEDLAGDVVGVHGVDDGSGDDPAAGDPVAIDGGVTKEGVEIVTGGLAPDPAAPVVEVAPETDTVAVGDELAVEITAELAEAVDDDLRVAVDFGDGSPAGRTQSAPTAEPTAEFTHTFDEAGDVVVSAAVALPNGTVGLGTAEVSVGEPAEPEPTSTAVQVVTAEPVAPGEDADVRVVTTTGDDADAAPEGTVVVDDVTGDDAIALTQGQLVDGEATLAVTFDDDAAGTRQVRATYEGSAVHQPSVSEPVDLEVAAPEAPVADAGSDRLVTVGQDLTLDASGSQPHDPDARFTWDLGDGRERTGESVTAAWDDTGEVTVELTVEAAGGVATDTAGITVEEAAADGLAVDVVDPGGEGIPQARVLVVEPDGTDRERTTDGDGRAVVGGLPDGEVAVYAIADGYRPTAAEAVVDAGQGEIEVELEPGALVAADLSARRLDDDEIDALGIDLDDPANQHVWEATVALDGATCAGFEGHVVTGAGDETLHGDFVCDGQRHSVSDGSFAAAGDGRVGTYTPDTCGPNGEPCVFYLSVPLEGRMAKEFFDVEFEVMNLADEPFTIEDATAQLPLPDGLSLAPTAEPQQAQVALDDIPGQQSRSAHWVVRGDEPGQYPLRATASGELAPFGWPVEAVGETDEPLKVWGADAVELTIEADEQGWARYPFELRVGLANVADIDVYNAQLTYLDGVGGGIYQPRQPRAHWFGTIEAGETEWAEPAILLPREDGSVDADASTVVEVAGDVPEARIATQDVIDPAERPRLVAHERNDHIVFEWDSADGATREELYRTADLATPFGAQPLATEPVGDGLQMVAADPDDGPQLYALSSVIDGQRRVAHGAVFASAVAQQQQPETRIEFDEGAAVSCGEDVAVSFAFSDDVLELSEYRYWIDDEQAGSGQLSGQDATVGPVTFTAEEIEDGEPIEVRVRAADQVGGWGPEAEVTITSDCAEGKRPVVLLPGIMGSHLAKDGGDGEGVWPPSAGDIGSPTTSIDDLALSSDGQTSLQFDVEVDRDSGANGMIESHLTKDVYGPMVEFFESEGYEVGETLFPYGTDWRLAPHINAERLWSWLESEGVFEEHSSVNLVAHSQGGLIAYEALTADDVAGQPGRERVERFVTAGTPWLGAADFTSILLHGQPCKAGGLGICAYNQETASRIVRHMPGALQLLPNEAYPQQAGSRVLTGHSPQAELDRYRERIGEAGAPLLDEAYTVASERVDERAIEEVDTLQVVGTQSDTTVRIEEVETDSCSWYDADCDEESEVDEGVALNYLDYKSGDGTVIEPSARMAQEVGNFPDVEWFSRSEVKHTELPNDDLVLDRIRDFLVNGPESDGTASVSQRRSPSARSSAETADEPAPGINRGSLDGLALDFVGSGDMTVTVGGGQPATVKIPYPFGEGPAFEDEQERQETLAALRRLDQLDEVSARIMEGQAALFFDEEPNAELQIELSPDRPQEVSLLARDYVDNEQQAASVWTNTRVDDETVSVTIQDDRSLPDTADVGGEPREFTAPVETSEVPGIPESTVRVDDAGGAPAVDVDASVDDGTGIDRIEWRTRPGTDWDSRDGAQARIELSDAADDVWVRAVSGAGMVETPAQHRELDQDEDHPSAAPDPGPDPGDDDREAADEPVSDADPDGDDGGDSRSSQPESGSESEPGEDGDADLDPMEATRLAGAHRYETAAEVATAAFDADTEAAYVATGAQFADALAGGPAAYGDDAPVLLTAPDALPAATQDALDELAPNRLVVLGGEQAVAPAVVDQLETHGSVERVAGRHRSATAAEIATRTFDGPVDRAYVATGDDFADAMSGGALAAVEESPVLLVHPDAVPQATAGALESLEVTDVTVLGGEAAVSADVVDAIDGLVDGGVDRLAGPTRFETTVEVAEQFDDPSEVFVTTGRTFPDTLSAGPVAARAGAPVLLVEPHGPPPDVVSAFVAAQTLERVAVIGGDAAVTPETARGIEEAAGRMDG